MPQRCEGGAELALFDRIIGRESPFIRNDDSGFAVAAASDNQPNRGDADDYWYTPRAMASATGLSIDADSAMRVAAVYRCRNILAETLASLPLQIYRRRDDGGKEIARDHPLYGVLHTRPNSWQTSFEFREMMMGHLVMRGNAYAQIVAGPRGFADQLIPLNPDRVRVERLDSNRLRYQVSQPNGQQLPLMQDEIMHVRGHTIDGIRGISMIDYMRDAIGSALAADIFGARFFANDGTPSGVLIHPKTLNETSANRIKKSFLEKAGGVMNSHSLMVLEEDMKYQQIGISNRDAQFLESRKFSVTEIARIFGIPPHMIADLDRATFSNIEQQSVEFVTYTMRPWLVCWEQAISRDLILAPDRYFAEFNVDGLLRGDIESRYAAYAIAVEHEWLSPNEVRALENMNPRDGGDTYSNPNTRPAAEQPVSKTRKAKNAPAQQDQPPQNDKNAMARLNLNGNGKVHHAEVA